MTTEELNALVERLEFLGECLRHDSPGVPVETAAASAIRQLMSEREEAVRTVRDVVEAWDWWQVDTYDRCSSVPGDAIRDARAFLSKHPQAQS